MSLILSLFPGLDVLGMGFEVEGFCIVKGPDVVWSGDIRTFHPPAGKFDGIIGGPPCQTFSALSNLVRAKGLEPIFGNLIPEFVRVIEETAPAWFLMENVPGVPFALWPQPEGYTVASFLIDNWASLGEEQSRKRRIWFGQRGENVAELRRWIEFATDLPPEVQAVCGDARAVPAALGGNGKVKRTATANDGRHGHREPGANRYSLAEMLELQGLPKDLLDHSPYTMKAKRKLVGNAVPLPMARALARAVREATR